jgi:hypothetical protein
LNDITTSVDEWYNFFLTLAVLSMNRFESCLEDAEKAKKEQEAMLKRYIINCLAKRMKFCVISGVNFAFSQKW